MAEANVAKKSKFKLFTIVLGLVVLLPVAGGGIFLATFDPDQYRPQIADFLSQKLGRKVSLNGKMRLRLAGGPALEINDLVFANPSWASRPDMARVGQMSLAVKLGPLLQTPRRLDVEKVTLSDADVQLERNAQGAKNWELNTSLAEEKQKAVTVEPSKGPGDAPEKAVPVADASGGKMPLAISLDQLLVKNLRFAMVESGKPKTEANIKELSLRANDKTVFEVAGLFNQQPFSMSLEGENWQVLADNKSWPFKAEAKFMGNDFAGNGQIHDMGKRIDVASFSLASSIGSKVTGNMTVNLAGARPDINGAIKIDAIEIPKGESEAAGTPPTDAIPEAVPEGAPAPRTAKRLFSDKKIDFSALKSADAKLDIAIGKITQGGIEVTNITLPLTLRNGTLALPEIMAQLAGNPLTAKLELNAAPPRLAFALNGRDMNLQPLLHAMGHDNIALGKTTLDSDLRTTGDSPRLMAENLDGTFLVKVGSSVLPAEAMGPVVSNMLKLLSPGSPLSARNQLTCATARFKAQDGLVTSNGILLDTSVASVAGEGTIDLHAEQMKMTFQPHTKDAKLAALATPMFVSGPLAQPNFRVDSAGVVAGLAASFLGKDLPVPVGRPALKVPMVNAAGADPCTDALDHPTYAPEQSAGTNSAGGIALDKVQGLTQGKVKNLTDKAPPVLKNLLGGDKSPLKGLFGQ